MKKPSKKSGPAGKRNTGSDGEPEQGSSRSLQRKYVLRLYVSGSTEKSTQAVENVKRVCEEYLKNHYDLKVIDIYQQPQLARGEQIVAVPTLIKRLPLPQRRLIGNMSDQEKLLLGLDLRKREPWPRGPKEVG